MSENKRDLLGKDLEVALEIFETSSTGGNQIYFSKLVQELEGRVSRNRISQALDRLFDNGIITAKFKKVNKKWARVYRISGEFEDFIESIHKDLED